jgi:hypothetical protein
MPSVIVVVIVYLKNLIIAFVLRLKLKVISKNGAGFNRYVRLVLYVYRVNTGEPKRAKDLGVLSNLNT